MSLDHIDYLAELERFAYPGELPHLIKLARRFADDEDDLRVLCNGAHVMIEGAEAVGYRDGDPLYDLALETFIELAAIVPAWRALRELPDYKIDRIVALARRSRGGAVGEDLGGDLHDGEPTPGGGVS